MCLGHACRHRHTVWHVSCILCVWGHVTEPGTAVWMSGESSRKHLKALGGVPKGVGTLSRMLDVKMDKCYVQFDLSSYCPFPIVLSGGSSYA